MTASIPIRVARIYWQEPVRVGAAVHPGWVLAADSPLPPPRPQGVLFDHGAAFAEWRGFTDDRRLAELFGIFCRLIFVVELNQHDVFREFLKIKEFAEMLPECNTSSLPQKA